MIQHLFDALTNDNLTAMIANNQPMKHFEEEYIFANGIEHYLLHYPKAPNSPVLLYLHGGPGEFESPFAYQLNETWGEMFTHVHWDQRGAGKTYRRNKTAEPETIEQLLTDLHGIVQHICSKYKTDKILLLGHSFGSLLGSLYVTCHPEYILSYIGTGQFISLRENESTVYRQTVALARQANNKAQLNALKRLQGYPPCDSALLLKQLPKLRKIRETYQPHNILKSNTGNMLTALLQSPVFQWQDLLPLLHAMKINRRLYEELLSIHLPDITLRYQVPVHYILGAADTITLTSLCEAYYEKIEAPWKSIQIIPNAAHNPMYETPEQFAAALCHIKNSL